MIAYIVIARALSPDLSITSLAAASAIVMFAASVPISFAGWGVREMSAIAALGAVGVTGHAAFTTAVLIGIGSLSAMGLIAIISLPHFQSERETAEPAAVPASAPTRSIDYPRALAWTLPIIAAIFVLFQIYVPIGSGLLNVNLADPIAILGASLFILNAIKSRSTPRWRMSFINPAIIIATLVLATSLLIGVYRFGWTDWAWINRFLGWFVILAYGATGALAVQEGGRDALRILAMTFVGAVIAVAGIDLFLVLLSAAGLKLSPEIIQPHEISGFSQNRNSFAFQMLMATGALVVFAKAERFRTVLFAVLLAAFWFAGSRSGWIAVCFVVAASIYFQTISIKAVVTAFALAAGFFLFVLGLQHLHFAFAAFNSGLLVPQILPDSSSTGERLLSMTGGLRLFFHNPIFGAGLGAFRQEMHMTAGGIPLIIHSTEIWLLAELGLAGFLAFVLPALHIFRSEWPRAKNFPTSTALILWFIAFAIMATPADMLYQRTFWLLLGAALAVIPAVPASEISPLYSSSQRPESRAELQPS